ncbi:MAG: Mov34/MPN/PAD-1 family protein [Janthinobacterium lividum]
MTLIFRVSKSQRLIFTVEAVKQMVAFAQILPAQSEAGGVLLGRHLLDSLDVVVDEVTVPQKADRRSRFSFFRSRMHEEFAQGRWLQQESTLAHLGLWHTHPEEDPVPSSVDRDDWRKAVLADRYEGRYLFFPIIGTRRIRVWCLNRRGHMRELKKEAKNG